MEAERLPQREPDPRAAIDWESFYRNYRKPGYVAGFEIVNKLGGGVFGVVFKARKESIGKDYAIKFLKVDDQGVRDAVLRELESVDHFAQIDHPNLVSIEDKGVVDGIPFIVMSFAGQHTLRTRIDERSLTPDEALRIFVQAARGVCALHEHSLVHFDLKPANIFLKGDIARVGDYGLSKLVTESRNSLSFGRGTPYYMAPEMLKRRGDARSDIYSLGVILYECLCGDVPFRGDSEWEVLRKHETEEPRIPDTVAPPLRAVILRCLAKDPDQRFQSVRDLLHELHAPASLGESFVLPRAGVRTTPPPLREAAPRTSPPPIPVDVDLGGPRSAFGAIVAAVFRAFEILVLAVLVPIRGVSVVVGQVLGFALSLPFKILAIALTLAGYLVTALAFATLIVAVFRLFA
ncbi:MAG: serine/threonine protein kinase [Planctomycetes bacterium]|nr:serine/threonine protein kinase [Planctomycetota bacterium]